MHCHSRESGNPAPAILRSDALTLTSAFQLHPSCARSTKDHLERWRALGSRLRGNDNSSIASASPHLRVPNFRASGVAAVQK